MSDEILWDGMRLPVFGLDVRTPADHGLTWEIGRSRVAPRPATPRLVVLHATDGEGSAKAVYRVLTARTLSVEFAIERDGTVFQFLDPAKVHAAHTGGLNAASVGIEVVCRQSGAQNPGGSRPRPRDEHIYQVVDKSVEPPRWVRSRRGSCWGFYPEQLVALELLVNALCTRMGVPALLADERDYVPPGERGALRGVIAHAQVTMGHSDPPLAAINLFRGATP